MSLPRIKQPLYRMTIPSTGEEIQYRSFLVKEEKILVLGMESGETVDVTDAITQVINNCIVTEGVSVDRLASFDVEWIFLNLRLRSVSDVMDLKSQCSKCESSFEFQVDLKDIPPPKPTTASNKIQFTEDIGIVLKYPTLNSASGAMTDNSIDSAFSIIASCIDKIYDKDAVYDSKDHDKQELVDWVLELSQTSFAMIEKFFEDLPAVRYEKDIPCPSCSESNKIILEGLDSFLG
jgi:hypothetical protein